MKSYKKQFSLYQEYSWNDGSYYHGSSTNDGDNNSHNAGYTLLEELRKRNIHSPLIIYAGSNTQENKDETKRRGGFGTTNNPQELFQLVINAIQNG